METRTVTLRGLSIPPSTNDIIRLKSKSSSALKQQYSETIKQALVDQQQTYRFDKSAHILVQVNCRMVYARDLDNIFKTLFDALVAGEVICDDRQITRIEARKLLSLTTGQGIDVKVSIDNESQKECFE